MATRNYYTTVYQGSTGPAANAFVATWNTANTSTGSSASNQIKLPLVSGGTYDFTVEWGDGNSDVITVWNQAQVTHTYTASGTYTIICTPNVVGGLTGWQFNNTGDRRKILAITQWGDWRSGNQIGLFWGCTNLTITASDAPVLTGTTTLQSAFTSCTSLGTSNLNSWDTSSVLNFSFAFFDCTNFNGNITSWNVGAGTNFDGMFHSCTNFNQNIGGWNMGSAVNMARMFVNATNFNQNIGSWNTASNTTLSQTFEGATAFNQNLNSWDVSKVTTLASAFRFATAFNGDISGWNTINVTSMPFAFGNCANFNQNLSGWNTSKVTSLSNTFSVATAFQSNLSAWDVNQVSDFSNFMSFKTGANKLTTANYDALLIGWAAQLPFHASARSINFGGAQYTLANPAVVAARAALVAHFTTAFVDGGGI